MVPLLNCQIHTSSTPRLILVVLRLLHEDSLVRKASIPRKFRPNPVLLFVKTWLTNIFLLLTIEDDFESLCTYQLRERK